MAKMIDAVRLMKDIYKRFGMTGMYAPIDFQEIVLEQPTVDAEPVRIGFWWHNSDSYEYSCGLCNEHSMDESRYCPNCGARMSDPTRTWYPGGHNA